MEVDCVSGRRVLIEQEEELSRGWSFRVRIESDPGTASYRTIRLSWVDHEYWCHGGSGPARVVEALVEFLLERDGLESLGESFDAAAVRRFYPSVDRELPERL